MNKFERTYIIGVRTRQIENGAQPKISPKKYGLFESDLIAEKEYELGLIPMTIVRTFPNGRKVRIRNTAATYTTQTHEHPPTNPH